MYCLSVLATLLISLVRLVASFEDTDYTELIPVSVSQQPRTPPVPGRKRTWHGSAYELRKNRRFYWLSPDHADQEVAVSLDFFAQANETILDLAEFADEIKSVTCTNPMQLTFRTNESYTIAVEAWQWVNANSKRSFILVESHEACGKKGRRRPWRVTDMIAHPSTLRVEFKLTKKTWKQVLNVYNLKWGDDGHVGIERRWGPSIGKSFNFDFSVAHTFPHTIFSTTEQKVGIGLVCNNCGTKGTMSFSGEVRASITGLDKASVTVKPKGIQAAINLGIELKADADLRTFNPFQKQWNLATIPIPDAGFKIPGILTIGPNVQINAGFLLNNIHGKALISTGVTATIPDDSVASIDLLAKKSVDVHGWKPAFKWDPLSTHAEINATAEFYVEAATAVSLLILDDTGFNIDAALRVPDIQVDVNTVHNSKGVCPGSKSKVGVQLDGSIGASIVLEGYAEANGKKTLFLDQPLYKTPKIITFPQGCVGLDSGIGDDEKPVPPKTTAPKDPPKESKPPPKETPTPKPTPPKSDFKACAYIAPGSEEDLSFEVPDSTKRWESKPLHWRMLESRSTPKKKPIYNLTCDKAGTKPLITWSYPGPKTSGKGGIPIASLLIGCDTEDCPPKLWGVKMTTLAKDPKILDTGSWASEHIYERNWIKEYMDYLFDNFFKGASSEVCGGLLKAFALGKGIQSDEPQPAASYAEAIMQKMGTFENYKKIMSIFPQAENAQKYNMFANKDIAKIYGEVGKTTPNESACGIGRIVSICKYMNEEEITSRLRLTAAGVDAILDAMDKDPAVAKLTPTQLNAKTYKKAHHEFFNAMYAAGFKNARARIEKYAETALKAPAAQIAKLDAGVRKALEDVSKGQGGYCTTSFSL